MWHWDTQDCVEINVIVTNSAGQSAKTALQVLQEKTAQEMVDYAKTRYSWIWPGNET